MSKRIHPSWIIAWLSWGVLAGIILSIRFHVEFISVSWLIIGVSVGFVCILSKRKALIIVAIIAGLILGLYRGDNVVTSQSGFAKYYKKQINLNGTVGEDTAFSNNGEQRIKLKNVAIDEVHFAGQVWVSTADTYEIKRSDNIEVSGLLREGFGSFPASMYRAEIIKIQKVTHADPAREVRDSFASDIRQSINEPEASLGIGFLTGQHTTLPENLNNNLRLLGLTHIVVASGYNLTILVRFARRLFARISKYLATLSSFFMISSFMLVTGISPSMSRAGLISGLSLTAWYFGRRIHPLVLLPFSAAITGFINPTYLWGDLGWYLSFAAFGGVMLLSPLLLDYFWGKMQPNALHQVLLETISAQIATAPIIAYTFSFYAPLALVANLLILPLIPAVMILTFISGIGAIFLSSLDTVIGFPAELLLKYMVSVINYLANLPFSKGNIEFGIDKLLYSYSLIIIFMIYIKKRTKHNYKQDSIIE